MTLGVLRAGIGGDGVVFCAVVGLRLRSCLLGCGLRVPGQLLSLNVGREAWRRGDWATKATDALQAALSQPVAPVDVGAPAPTMGATLRVTASALNLRAGAGSSNAILTSMPSGASEKPAS